MIFGEILTLLIAYVTLGRGYHYLDHVESLPSSWLCEGPLQEGTEYDCYERCALKSSKYFALSEKLTHCCCGDELPVKNSNNNNHSHDRNNNNNNNGGGNEQYYYKEKEVRGRSSLSSYSLFLLNGSDRRLYRRDGNDPTTVVVTPQERPTVKRTVAVTEAPPASASGTPPQDITTGANHETSVVFRTSIRTQSASTIVHTVTQSATPSPAPAPEKSGKTHRHANVGAIVGGVVGGVGGAAVAAVLILLLVRHFNKRRQQERMEQEYQEAIKPVDYIGYDHHSTSKSTSGGGGGGNGLLAGDISGDKSQPASYTSTISRGLSSGSFDDDSRERSFPVIANPFDDPRRGSNPSVATHKILQVANPDEEDKQ